MSLLTLPSPFLFEPLSIDRLPDSFTGRTHAQAKPQPPAELPPVWRATELAHEHSGVHASGFAALDAELPGGGWPQRNLIELLTPQPGVGELRLLAPVLRSLTRQSRSVVLLAPPCIPYGPALQQLSIDISQVLVVQARQPADRLWAIEQTLRSPSFGALITWLPETAQSPLRPESLRRLQLAAQSSQGLFWALRPLQAARNSSPAILRLQLDAAPGNALQLRILKRRGPVHAQALTLNLEAGLPSRQYEVPRHSSPIPGLRAGLGMPAGVALWAAAT
jgi:hypothetical protein